VKVENGVDEFRNYLERHGDNARSTAPRLKRSRAPLGAGKRQKRKRRMPQPGKTISMIRWAT